MAFIDQITLPLFILWIIGLILSFFRRDLDFLWKAFFLLIFMFYVIQFHEELFAGYYRFKYNYAKEIVNWIYGIGTHMASQSNPHLLQRSRLLERNHHSTASHHQSSLLVFFLYLHIVPSQD